MHFQKLHDNCCFTKTRAKDMSTFHLFRLKPAETVLRALESVRGGWVRVVCSDGLVSAPRTRWWYSS